MRIDPPVGTADERVTGDVWPGFWFDATGFATHYRLFGNVWAYHTGADLNLNKPHWNADANAPVYAIADGVVTSSKLGTGTWGWVIIIRHVDDDGKPFYSRYAHVNHFQFPVARKDDVVSIGQVIAHIGDADGKFADHLHFDISHTDILSSNPDHWPGDISVANVKNNYSDPRQFILNKRTAIAPPTDNPDNNNATEKLRVTATWLRIRPLPNTTLGESGWLQFGDIVEVQGNISANGYHFAKIKAINGTEYTATGYTAREFLEPV